MGLIVFWVIMALAVAIIAGYREKSAGLWFLYGLLIWPIALVHVLVSPPNTAAVEAAAIQGGTMKKCPQCAELIKAEAIKCRYCQSDVSSTVSIRPDPSKCWQCGTTYKGNETACANCGRFKQVATQPAC